ncbi:hypothetical protein [Cellulomonas sp. SG140]|uniref:hypothetical protein n=1 Tax=Cellulomonas sp. SG140 TaxID=2976536 RepID=UPI0021E6F1EE|nr:hypothetical protein [Cellulomonas sp. SG140]
MTWPYEPQPPDQQPYGEPAPPPFTPPNSQPYAPPSAQPYGQPAQQPYGSPYQPPAQPYQPPEQPGYPPYGSSYQQPYPQGYPQPYRPYLSPPPRRSSRALPWLIGLGVLVFIVVMGAIALPVVRQQHAACGSERAPFGASAAATAYVRAVNASYPDWSAMSDTIRAQDMKVRPDQMVMQLQGDEKFLAALKTIPFSASQRPAADGLITAIEQYDAFVQTASQNPGYLSANQEQDRTLNDARALASSRLRNALRLPLSSCTYNRP